jgi:hypothetical protein
MTLSDTPSTPLAWVTAAATEAGASARTGEAALPAAGHEAVLSRVRASSRSIRGADANPLRVDRRIVIIQNLPWQVRSTKIANKRPQKFKMHLGNESTGLGQKHQDC